jgi:hypothetical protein
LGWSRIHHAAAATPRTTTYVALHVRRAGHGHPIRSIRRALLVSVSVPPRARRQIAISKHQMHRKQKKKPHSPTPSLPRFRVLARDRRSPSKLKEIVSKYITARVEREGTHAHTPPSSSRPGSISANLRAVTGVRRSGALPEGKTTHGPHDRARLFQTISLAPEYTDTDSGARLL